MNNENIKKDPTKNDRPTRLLQKITNYSKSVKTDKGEKERIKNYQVSHIFGRTKNPFLFAAPWNIVWKSKILDPFTGHESKGENSDKYKKAFINKSKELYSDYIVDYNKLVSKYFSSKKLELAFNKMSLDSSIDERKFSRFKMDVKNELKPIE